MSLSKLRSQSIRTEIENHLKSYGYTYGKLGDMIGVNQGHISEILRSKRAISIGQLDSLAKAFGYDPGWLYDRYAEECISDGKVARPRTIPFLIRCVEIGRYDYMQSLIASVLEAQSLDILFSVAEQLFQERKLKDSAYFYQLIIDNEKDSHSDIFVMSHYRLFRAIQGTNTNAEEIWKAVIRFEPYRNRLQIDYQLDSLLQLANVCFSLHKWKEVEKYADELRELATFVYQTELNNKKNNKERKPLKSERHLVVYYGQGYLAKAAALKKQKLYEEAKKFVYGYTDLKWFEFLDEKGLEEVNKFEIWGQINLYTLDLLLGNLHFLEECADYLANHTNEIYTGLVTILEAANQHGFCVDGILERFSHHISSAPIEKENALNISRHFRFRYQKAMYESQRGRFTDAIDEVLLAIEFAGILNQYLALKKCVSLFEKFREHALERQIIAYKNIVNEGDE